jgi:hypothetical protein
MWACSFFISDETDIVPPQAFTICIPVPSAALLLRRLIPGRPWRRLHRRLVWLLLRLHRRLVWLLLRWIGRLLRRIIWLLLLVLLRIRRGRRVPADYQGDDKAYNPQEEPQDRVTGAGTTAFLRDEIGADRTGD